ncbi:MAG: hypothetical protein DCC75_12135 [Proteobacteria bacterium]|nr:MAG: hypothetical protein DCC75_12135 [Pseudomonadota bacterium]
MTEQVAKQGSSIEMTVSAPLRFWNWLVSELRWLVRVLVSSGDRFYWDNGFSKAASLAYTSLLSLVPLFALVFGILATFATSKDYVDQVREFLFKQFVPDNQFVDTVLDYLNQFSATISSLNILVFGFLVITALLLINSVEYALNETWQVYEPRPIGHRVAIFCAILLIGPVLFISAYYFTKLRFEPFLIGIGISTMLYSWYQFLLPCLIDFIAFLSLYYLVPRAPVRLNSAIFGAFIAALLFNLAKISYAVYLEEFASYDKVYSTLAAIPISLFWLYLAWIIVLLGAESCYQAQYLPKFGKVWKRSVLSVGDARLILAFQSLAMIFEAFSAGKRAPNDLELAEALGCSTVVLKPTLDALERARILSRGDSREMPLALLRSPETISLGDIKKALFGERAPAHFAAQMAKLYERLIDDRNLDKAYLSEILQTNKERLT